jgi:hypothetical protein
VAHAWRDSREVHARRTVARAGQRRAAAPTHCVRPAPRPNPPHQADVVNRGMSGYTTRWAAPLLAPTLHQLSARGQRVLLLVLWFGANDAALPGRSACVSFAPGVRVVAGRCAATAPWGAASGCRGSPHCAARCTAAHVRTHTTRQGAAARARAGVC